MRYTRTDPALSRAVYTVWYSSNLATWLMDTGAIQHASTPDEDGVQTVDVTVSPVLLSNPKLFIRIQAE